MRINKEKFDIVLARKCISVYDVVNGGISQTTLFRTLSGKETKPKTVGKIANILDVDVTEII